jgi:hypothetical protein
MRYIYSLHPEGVSGMNIPETPQFLAYSFSQNVNPHAAFGFFAAFPYALSAKIHGLHIIQGDIDFVIAVGISKVLFGKTVLGLDADRTALPAL